MQTLIELLQVSKRNQVAIGHFNFSDLVTLQAIFSSAQDLGVPVLAGVSEGERAFVGVRQAAALVKSLREEHGFPIFLNADHTHSLKNAEAAAKAGFDEIIFDRSDLPFEQNVAETRKAVEAIKSIDASIVIEGEIGYIGTSSEVLETLPKGMAPLTTPEEAEAFVKETQVDVLAPAVGNMHGMLKSMVEGTAKKRLDLERIRAIASATGVFLTLHGGSGTNDEDFRKAIKAGVTIVHINTEIRVAWRHGIEMALNRSDEVAPYKILPGAFDAVKKVVTARLQLFNGLPVAAVA